MEPIGQPAEQRLGAKAVEVKRATVLALVCTSHAINHLSSSILPVLYPMFMRQFGFGYQGIALLSNVNQLTANSLQGIYGFIARFTGRGTLLGIGNLVVALGGLGLGLAQGYPQILVSSAVRSAGSSPQHPTGAAMLVSHFPKDRARVLTLHQSAGNVGGWIGPWLAGAMLFVMGWREMVWILAVPSILMALIYFGMRESLAPAASAGGKGRAKLALADYKLALRNRNVLLISLAMMAGAAGRGTGVLNTFLTPWLVDSYGVSDSKAAFFFGIMTFGGIVGPIALGWLAARTSDKLMAQFVLVGSALLTVTVVLYPSASWLLGAHLLLAGGFIWARSPFFETVITQASDESTLDTLLSVYFLISFASGPIWTQLTGTIFDHWGAAQAFGLMAGSYVVGDVILSFVRIKPKQGQAKAGG